MAGIYPLEIRKDTIGDTLYASRNHNQLRQTYQAPGANRGQVDWTLTLRQNRKPLGLNESRSAPQLTQPNPHRREPLAPEHPDGPYHCESETMGRYQNYANTAHMTRNLVRVSSGAAHSIDWQCNLRGGLHRDEFKAPGWRRHYARPQQSFDMMAENCGRNNEEYHLSETTPQDRRPDRRSGALPCETIRDDPISFRRWPGCEGTSAGQWEHLLSDHSRGHKARRQIQHETTLREHPGDESGARICDNRSDGCLVEMLGKKRQYDITHHEPLARRGGDPRLHHKYNMHPLPQQDEEVRALRMYKQQRHPNEAGEQWESKASHR
mmetsp:Transcript_45750/g.98747  ORF Transcript_45750/g.98747 Transcript_45750/m.98747 type:complete len:323 (-) Transcript_45750:41-1009(-)